MPVQQGVNEITLTSGGTIAAGSKHRAGVVGAAGLALAGAGVLPDVILLEDAVTNTDDHVNCAHVASSMRVVVQLGGTVVAGDLLTTDASGDFVTGTSGDATCLRAEEGGASGEFVRALVIPAQSVA